MHKCRCTSLAHQWILCSEWVPSSAGRYTGSYRIPVFIFLMIWIFKKPQYRCHLNNVRNATLFEKGLFSLLHCGEDTAVCVTERESSETEAVELVERDDTEELIHNIHRPLPSAPASHTALEDVSSAAPRARGLSRRSVASLCVSLCSEWQKKQCIQLAVLQQTRR